jgi:hypothetical protein
LSNAFDEAINSDSVKQGLLNSMQANAHNLGPEGTYKMMSQGAEDIKALVTAAKNHQ